MQACIKDGSSAQMYFLKALSNINEIEKKKKTVEEEQYQKIVLYFKLLLL